MVKSPISVTVSLFHISYLESMELRQGHPRSGLPEQAFRYRFCEPCLQKASAKPKQQAKKSAAAGDEGMNPTQYFENRLRFLAAQKESGRNPYPHKFEAKLTIPEYVKRYESLNSGDHLEDVEESIAGRLMNKRSSSKLFFYDLHGGGAKVQVMADARKSELDEDEFSRFHSSVKRGDILGIIGFPGAIEGISIAAAFFKYAVHSVGKSKRGELSIFPKTFVVLSHNATTKNGYWF